MIANTFGTFLDTIKKLEEQRSPVEGGFPESEVLKIAKMLAGAGGTAPLPVAMAQAGMPEAVFFRSVFAGKDKGIFQIDETQVPPILGLTNLGRGFAG